MEIDREVEKTTGKDSGKKVSHGSSNTPAMHLATTTWSMYKPISRKWPTYTTVTRKLPLMKLKNTSWYVPMFFKWMISGSSIMGFMGYRPMLLHKKATSLVWTMLTEKKKKTFLKNASGNNNKQDFVNSSKEMRKRIF